MFNLKGLNTDRGLNTWSGIMWELFYGRICIQDPKSITRSQINYQKVEGISFIFFYFCFLAMPFSQPGSNPHLLQWNKSLNHWITREFPSPPVSFHFGSFLLPSHGMIWKFSVGCSSAGSPQAHAVRVEGRRS